MRSQEMLLFTVSLQGWRTAPSSKALLYRWGPYFQTHLLARSVDVDEEEQQEVEEDADDPQQGQEPLLRGAEVWTREVHVKHLATLNITQTDKHDKYQSRFVL